MLNAGSVEAGDQRLQVEVGNISIGDDRHPRAAKPPGDLHPGQFHHAAPDQDIVGPGSEVDGDFGRSGRLAHRPPTLAGRRSRYSASATRMSSMTTSWATSRDWMWISACS